MPGARVLYSSLNLRVCFQVIFSFPPRDETLDFLETCTGEGYGWRLLAVIDEAHLINPVHIIQLLPCHSTQKV